ncbi:hypothetical protein [Bacillus marinisedimentorum]|uniref:hypothetical protein n=1 Tax=Bacillus marinisedimentorum TaxID=1821260 RepID=UPI000B1ADAA7|nr:hypothetical protein [Bacillus marinisedimentorum]
MAWMEVLAALAVLFFMIFIRTLMLKQVYQPQQENPPTATQKETCRNTSRKDPFDNI